MTSSFHQGIYDQVRGIQLTPHKDGLPGRGYIDQFSQSMLGPGMTHNYGSPHSIRSGHVDIIQRTDGQIFHHRVYRP